MGDAIKENARGIYSPFFYMAKNWGKLARPF
jgi:hypothetical protein